MGAGAERRPRVLTSSTFQMEEIVKHKQSHKLRWKAVERSHYSAVGEVFRA